MSELIKTKKILTRIAQEVAKRAAPSLRKEVEAFVHLYYANTSPEDLEEASLEFLVSSAFEMWTLGFMRKPEEVKIKVYSHKGGATQRRTPQTIVEIINDDLPFLLDSITGVINNLGYSIHLVIHTVMQVERNKKHFVERVSKRSSRSSSSPKTYESFIHCDILDYLSPEKIEILTCDLKVALSDVRSAVEDWAPMKQKLHESISALQKNHPLRPPEELKEALEFLEWIGNDHFTFLGFCEYSLPSKKSKTSHHLLSDGGLGILRDPSTQEISKLFGNNKLTSENQRYIVDCSPLLLTKTVQTSRVHRQDPMDSIMVKKFNADGTVIGLYQFIGLFTSVAYKASIREIPLLRQKVSHILLRSGFAEDWHDGRTLIHILESFPRDELFQASEDWLFETSMAILQLKYRQRLTVFTRLDKFERFISCIVYVPREKYDTELRRKIEKVLEQKFHSELTNWQVQLGELDFVRLHYTFKLFTKEKINYTRASLEEAIGRILLTWKEELESALFSTAGEEKGLSLFEQYGQGFSHGYQEQFTPHEAAYDILEIDNAFSKNRLQAHLQGAEDESYLRLKMYSTKGPISLSDILPILKNMNLNVLTENPFTATRFDTQKVWIHDFAMQTRDKAPVSLEDIKESFLDSLDGILRGRAENDGFNRLTLKAQFTWRECQLIRAYAKYIRQLQGTFTPVYMEETLVKYPYMCRLMLELFSCQFSPSYPGDRQREKDKILKKVREVLSTVNNLDEDRILRKFVNAISATLRTNFYQFAGTKPKSYISFKIDCQAIEEMPLPRPLYEIFVYSAQVEAIHLRGAKVARGGIRWSNRKEDFRTEILGLMKAQIVKNAVIIPSGSKGGFIVKNPSSLNPSQEEVISCYQTMICGLLDITDNLEGETVIPPLNVVRWDTDDPYLVVAADKGTSAFSDYANQLSADYKFWLGDAFASGGSTGYDHKKMAITSRGVWEAVKCHFREMHRDATKEELTVVGIGDMSGDVFGNGMLLSHHLKLVAAFNHLHIFIDPSPNPEKSYAERKRLFNLPFSTWADYNREAISPGGGVFDRQVKSIPLTPQIKKLFEIEDDTLSPPELIQCLLRAPVDLIWFGGIGTYIKSKTETSLDVGDPTNDDVRINGQQVRAKVIAEGANLGITQLGRIEYAENGGRLNTDAIDNSAGVDCSDHEVNIKILLNKVVKSKKLSLQKRNRLLHEMTDDVAHLVLRDNFLQVQAISFAQRQGVRLFDEQTSLIRDLEEEGLLNRALAHLPDEAEIARRLADNRGLTRPELAVLLAYAKISLNKHLLESSIPDLQPLQQSLFNYFPERLQHTYKKEIAVHPLRREIISTLFSSSIINRMGMTFVYEMRRQANVSIPDVARTYFIIRELLDLSSLWHELEALTTLSPAFQSALMLDVYENVKRFTEWFLRCGALPQEISIFLKTFKPAFDRLKVELPSLLTAHQMKTFEEKCYEYEKAGVPSTLSERLLSLEPLVAAPDIITLSKELPFNVKTVGKVYYALGQQLGFEWLRKAAQSLTGDSHWQQEAARTLIEDLYVTQRSLTQKVLMRVKPSDKLFKPDGTLISGILSTSVVETLLLDLMNASTVDFAMLTVINRHLRMIA